MSILSNDSSAVTESMSFRICCRNFFSHCSLKCISVIPNWTASTIIKWVIGRICPLCMQMLRREYNSFPLFQTDIPCHGPEYPISRQAGLMIHVSPAFHHPAAKRNWTFTTTTSPLHLWVVKTALTCGYNLLHFTALNKQLAMKKNIFRFHFQVSFICFRI